MGNIQALACKSIVFLTKLLQELHFWLCCIVKYASADPYQSLLWVMGYATKRLCVQVSLHGGYQFMLKGWGI